MNVLSVQKQRRPQFHFRWPRGVSGTVVIRGHVSKFHDPQFDLRIRPARSRVSDRSGRRKGSGHAPRIRTGSVLTWRIEPRELQRAHSGVVERRVENMRAV